VLLAAGFDELVDQLGCEDIANGVPGLRGGGAEGGEQVRLASAGVANQAEWLPGLDPSAAGELVAAGTFGLAVKSNSSTRLSRWESGGFHSRTARRLSRPSHSAITNSARNPQ
jgi:hypothetical protein